MSFQLVGFLDNDNTQGFGPENYILYRGLDPTTTNVLGDYQVFVKLFSGFTETWRLTARISGVVVLEEEGNFLTSHVSPVFNVTLGEYNANCGGTQ